MSKGHAVPAPQVKPMDAPAEQQRKTIDQLSLVELKVLAYDLSAEISQRTALVNAINEEIRKRGLSSPQ